jgi:hypothetical protein
MASAPLTAAAAERTTDDVGPDVANCLVTAAEPAAEPPTTAAGLSIQSNQFMFLKKESGPNFEISLN